MYFCEKWRNYKFIFHSLYQYTQDMKNGTAWLANFSWFIIKFQEGKKVVLHCGSFIFLRLNRTPKYFFYYFSASFQLSSQIFFSLSICPEIADFGIWKSKFNPGDLIVVSNLIQVECIFNLHLKMLAVHS